MKWPNVLLTPGLLVALTATSTAEGIVPATEKAMIAGAVARNIPDPLLRTSFVRLVSAIRRTENGRPGFEFGVEHPAAKGIEKQAGWCASIVWKRWTEWAAGDMEEPFLVYLARRYCPVNRDVWCHNVIYFLEKQE